MSGFLAMLAGVGVQNGYLSPSPKYGNRPKVILGSIIGYFLGKFSYANTCADKFLVEAPDSHIADMIRYGPMTAQHSCQVNKIDQ